MVSRNLKVLIIIFEPHNVSGASYGMYKPCSRAFFHFLSQKFYILKISLVFRNLSSYYSNCICCTKSSWKDLIFKGFFTLISVDFEPILPLRTSFFLNIKIIPTYSLFIDYAIPQQSPILLGYLNQIKPLLDI